MVPTERDTTMSDIPADYRDQLDLRAIIAQIDRDRAETRKLQGETEKFVAEQHKLMSEAKKFGRDWWIIPLTVLGGIVAGAVARLPEILHALGR
jgi:3-dehydroquinate synthase class II